MVCECGHNRDRHESGRDYGYHGWQCTGIIVDGKRKYCSCGYYRKKTKVEYYTKKTKEVVTK